MADQTPRFTDEQRLAMGERQRRAAAEAWTRCSCSRTSWTSRTAASSCCCAKCSPTLIIALKGASEDMREKIFKNMSQRAAEMMRDDLESKGPVRLSEVEAQQKEILVIVRRLADEGQISLGGNGEEKYV